MHCRKQVQKSEYFSILSVCLWKGRRQHSWDKHQWSLHEVALSQEVIGSTLHWILANPTHSKPKARTCSLDRHMHASSLDRADKETCCLKRIRNPWQHFVNPLKHVTRRWIESCADYDVLQALAYAGTTLMFWSIGSHTNLQYRTCIIF